MATQSVLSNRSAGVGDAGAPVVPLRHPIGTLYLGGLAVAMLTLGAAAAGVLSAETLYPVDLRAQSLANDIITLAIGLPVLLLALWLARRGHLLGLLVWPGALFYGIYNYVTYVYTLPLTVLWPVYVLIVVLSAYSIAGLLAAVDAAAVAGRLRGRLPVRLAAGALGLVAVLVLGLAVPQLVEGVNTGSMGRAAMGLALADMTVAVAWLVGAVLLWREQGLGYLLCPGFLFQGVMLFVGLAALMLLEPGLGGQAYPLTEIGVVLLLGLPIYVPFGLTIRAVRQADRLPGREAS